MRERCQLLAKSGHSAVSGVPDHLRADSHVRERMVRNLAHRDELRLRISREQRRQHVRGRGDFRCRGHAVRQMQPRLMRVAGEGVPEHEFFGPVSKRQHLFPRNRRGGLRPTARVPLEAARPGPQRAENDLSWSSLTCPNRIRSEVMAIPENLAPW